MIGTQEEVHYTPIISVPNDLDLPSSSGFPRSESMESADRFMPNLLLSPQGEDGYGKLPPEIGRSGSTGDIYGQQLPPIPSAVPTATGANLTAAFPGNVSSLSSSSSSLPQTSISNGVNVDSSNVSSRPPPTPGSIERILPGGVNALASNLAMGSSTSSLMPSQQIGTSVAQKPIQSCRSVPNIQVANEVAAPAHPGSVPQAVTSSSRPPNSSSGSSLPSSSSPSVPHRTIINVNTSREGSGGIVHYGGQQQQFQQQVYSKQSHIQSYESSSSSFASPYFPSTNNIDQASPANIDISVSQVSLGSSGGDPSSVFDEDELSRMKHASRRTSRAEKRYHTADSITDMKPSQEKDASIHKRLSWRTDVQVVDNKNLGSPNKVLSTDSVRSYPSSSGVSSTGSLHMNLESDISEESEVSGFGGSTEVGLMSRTREKMFTVGDGLPDPQPADNVDSNFDLANNNSNRNELQGRTQYLEVEEDELSVSDSSQGRSKSTPDLVTMFNNTLRVSEMEDGIVSVEVSSDAFNRKLTHADILKMKKLKHQVLYDANVESS